MHQVRVEVPTAENSIDVQPPGRIKSTIHERTNASKIPIVIHVLLRSEVRRPCKASSVIEMATTVEDWVTLSSMILLSEISKEDKPGRKS